MRGIVARLTLLVAGMSLLSPARAADAVPQAAEAQGAIQTTHLVSLTNGKAIRCNFVETTAGVVRLTMKPFGSFEIPEDRVAEIKAEAGSIPVSPRAEKAEEAPPAEPEKPPPVRPEPDRGTQLVPPEVPQAYAAEIERLLYDLCRERPNYRVRAERSLKALGPIAVGPVIPFTAHPSWLVRCAALRILGQIAHPAGVPALWKALADSHPIVRQVAYENLTAATGMHWWFHPMATEGARQGAIDRWEAFLREKELLPAQAAP
jgi:HEAT repeat protein